MAHRHQLGGLLVTPQVRARCYLQGMLRIDKQLYIAKTQKHIRNAANSNYLNIMHKGINRLKKFQRKPPLAVKLEDGTLAQSPEQVVQIWKRLSAAVHEGRDVELGTLAVCADQTIQQYRLVERCLDLVPSRQDATRAFKVAKKGRTFGDYALPPELFALFRAVLGAAYRPSMVKSSRRSATRSAGGGACSPSPRSHSHPTLPSGSRRGRLFLPMPTSRRTRSVGAGGSCHTTSGTPGARSSEEQRG